MSLIIHKNAYQDFLNLLLQWQQEINSSHFEGGNSQRTREQDADNRRGLLNNSTVWQNLKKIFQERIIPLTDEDLDLAVASRWISLQAEIQREFRLLETDWLFLLSSRQLATQKTRHQSIGDRLQKLIGYCQAMLEIG